MKVEVLGEFSIFSMQTTSLFPQYLFVLRLFLTGLGCTHCPSSLQFNFVSCLLDTPVQSNAFLLVALLYRIILKGVYSGTLWAKVRGLGLLPKCQLITHPHGHVDSRGERKAIT